MCADRGDFPLTLELGKLGSLGGWRGVLVPREAVAKLGLSIVPNSGRDPASPMRGPAVSDTRGRHRLASARAPLELARGAVENVKAGQRPVLPSCRSPLRHRALRSSESTNAGAGRRAMTVSWPSSRDVCIACRVRPRHERSLNSHAQTAASGNKRASRLRLGIGVLWSSHRLAITSEQTARALFATPGSPRPNYHSLLTGNRLIKEAGFLHAREPFKCRVARSANVYGYWVRLFAQSKGSYWGY